MAGAIQAIHAMATAMTQQSAAANQQAEILREILPIECQVGKRGTIPQTVPRQYDYSRVCRQI
jgi:hypothetical protein